MMMKYVEGIIEFVNSKRGSFFQEDISKAVRVNKFKIRGVLDMLDAMGFIEMRMAGRVPVFCSMKKFILREVK